MYIGEVVRKNVRQVSIRGTLGGRCPSSGYRTAVRSRSPGGLAGGGSGTFQLSPGPCGKRPGVFASW